MQPFTVTVTIDPEVIASTLISAVEFGIYYWAQNVEAIIPDDIDTTGMNDGLSCDFVFALMTPGCKVRFEEHYGDGSACRKPKVHEIDYVNLQDAFKTIVAKFPHHVETILNGGDSNSGDCLWQLMVFPDDTKYG